MKTHFTACLLAATCMAASTYEEKKDYLDCISQKGKGKAPVDLVEFEKRTQQFIKNKAKANQMNKNSKSRAQFGLGITCDETPEEFKKRGGAMKPEDLKDDNSNKKRGLAGSTSSGLEGLSQYKINWVERGNVGPVKSQGLCGSCWAFASTTAQEAMQSITQGKSPVRLSEQEGVDCVEDLWGCYGGWSEQYWRWSRDNGTMLEADYPYEGYDNLCRNQEQKNLDTGDRIASRALSSDYILGENRAVDMARELQNGPLVAAVQADDCWEFYLGGILTQADLCSNQDINHLVVIVGLDQTSDGMWYWIVQNSWSEYWGAQGFIYIEVADDLFGVSALHQWPQKVIVDPTIDPAFWGCEIQESMNELGPGRCDNSNQCHGQRTCSVDGFCVGKSGCDTEPDLWTINDKLDQLITMFRNSNSV